MLTMLPTKEEIYNDVFALNKDGAPGLDGFGAIFYQTYSCIIKEDVYKDVLEFFAHGWLLPIYNSNTIVLIPKTDHADTVGQFRPIALANL